MAQTITTDHPKTYVLGHSPSELRRLDAQRKVLREYTERLLRDAGIGPGMRVLDAGCGTGDISVLAAELVGARGQVVGIDRSPEALAMAHARAETKKIEYLSFEEADVADYTTREPFDAVVGRLVLGHQPEPAAVVRRLARQVRPGGVVAFAELAVIDPPAKSPSRPEFIRLCTVLPETMRRGGVHLDMGFRLYATVHEAGLPAPAHWVEGILIPRADETRLTWPIETMRSRIPAAERTGVTTAADLGIDSLRQRVFAEATTMAGVNSDA